MTLVLHKILPDHVLETEINKIPVIMKSGDFIDACWSAIKTTLDGVAEEITGLETGEERNEW